MLGSEPPADWLTVKTWFLLSRGLYASETSAVIEGCAWGRWHAAATLIANCCILQPSLSSPSPSQPQTHALCRMGRKPRSASQHGT